jgi:CxxC motif-containing protein (DUF1111 family)
MSTKRLVAASLAAMLAGLVGVPVAQQVAKDPGVRGGPPAAGDPLPGLTRVQLALFEAGKEDFEEAEGVGDGLGPRFNLDSCGGCHLQPAVGGTSPAVNPQVKLATAFGARNVVPSFIKADGPVREVRYQYNPDGTRDGGVHALFVISGRVDRTGNASNCTIRQEDFETQVRNNNVIFRIPTPTFGLGLIEQISDGALLANQAVMATQKAALGIRGRPNRVRISGTMNRNGNDGTISRFGWKAQNKSLLLFSGEAYNVEMGITNELFQTERDESPNCQFATVPNDTTPEEVDPKTAASALPAIEKFALFMRFLAPPTPSPDTPGGTVSIGNGRKLFSAVGCALCHTPTLYTSDRSTVEALRKKPVNLFSDLMLHSMGRTLADDIAQGEADPDEFRTAPLWGLGQRIFLLHDGRTKDLVEAIQAHRSGPSTRYPASEANAVVDNYNRLSERDKQDMLNFLRSL